MKSKNIHIIPTDKPTGIFESKNGLHFSIIEKNRYGEFKGFHIYITNDEEIKEGDWFVQVNTKKIIKHHPKNGLLLQPQSFDKKNILTTDQDLIKDGVQAIDDEFLEWFVKNPSCEFVETYSLGVKNQLTGESGHYKYEIIITQEEPKSSCPKCRTTDFDNCHSIHCPMRKEEPKQETLEEAAEKYCLINNIPTDQMIVKTDRSCEFETPVTMFIKGAKWQQERRYSKEEVLNFTQTILMQYKFGNTNIEQMDLLKETLEQFKKK
jgi:hypothetical protein